MNEKFKSEFDQIKASPQLKNQTLNYIYQQQHQPRRRRFFPKAMLSALAVLIAVLFSFNYFNQAQSVMALSIDGDLAVEMEVDQDREVIKITGYDELSTALIDSQDYLSENYLEVIESLQEEVSNQLAIAVVYFSETTTIDSLLETAVVVPTANFQKAHQYNMTFGKYHACLNLSQINSEYPVEECFKMSFNQIQTQIQYQQQKQAGMGSQNGNPDSGNSNSNQNQGEQGGAGQGKSIQNSKRN